MTVSVAKSAGFCFGVNLAINRVYNELKYGKLYTYGHLIHNDFVIRSLEDQGVFSVDDLNDVHDGSVVIRSHGVGPDIYNFLNDNNLNFVDCTCPYVKKIHSIVDDYTKKGFKIIIVGNSEHPEVVGINGWAYGNAIIINNVFDVDSYTFSLDNKYVIVSQTTFRNDSFYDIVDKLSNFNIDFMAFNTICNETSKRQKEAVLLAKNVDKMIVIGDSNSSNTQKLFQICKKYCVSTFLIQSFVDIQLNNFNSNDKIGITAGASTPSAIIKEVINIMSELENQSTSNIEETFEQMLDDSFVTLHTGDVVKGTVIQVNNDEVSVNLGYKSDGIIEKSELSNDPNVDPKSIVSPGDEIEVYVIRVNDGEGNVLLSRKKIQSQRGMEILENAYNEKTVVSGKITEVVKGGVIAIVNEIRVFVPSSQVSNRYIADLESLKGTSVNLNIIEFDKTKRRIVGGRKELANKEYQENKERIFNSVESGQKIKGTVSRLTDFGAFVDLGGVDGLIHISEISWGMVKHPKDVLTEGQSVDVIVLGIDKSKGKISLSLKDKESDPWNSVLEKYEIGAFLTGKVVRMVPFGAFIELEPGVDGLVHISQIANRHVVKPEDELSIGQSVNVKVLDVNLEQKRISLSIKEAAGISVEESEKDVADDNQDVVNDNSDVIDDNNDAVVEE